LVLKSISLEMYISIFNLGTITKIYIR
jgi:hypothetical protein